MNDKRALKHLVNELINELNLPGTESVYMPIYTKMQQALGIGYDIGRVYSRKVKPVAQMDMDGKVINAFASVKMAASLLDIDPASISHAIHGRYRKSAGGFKWKFINEKDYYEKRRIADIIITKKS